MLITMMLRVVYKDYLEQIEYKFDLCAFFVTLLSFALLYELMMFSYSRKIKNSSMKEIMLD